MCNSMILTSRRRHFYLVGQSKHKVGACGVDNQASAVLADNELPIVAFSLSLSLSQKKQISRKTVARRLRGGDRTQTCCVCLKLTRQHCTARLQWCREHQNGLNRTHAYYSQMRSKNAIENVWDALGRQVAGQIYL
ncbi:hypothetical protein TNCV_628441 [Trichonephila clavipes]|nr:hypothetical protein TNCV_628441 [Trichonephila clavipes]